MRIHTTIASLRAARAQAGRVALVPTMGNLHDGHITLMHEAARRADTVVASVFINRLQFGAGEDFEHYPRTFEADCDKLQAAGVAHVFAPAEAEMYPRSQRYQIDPAPEQTAILEGAFRPGHFRGVATVVLKLLNITTPDIALFGKKDYQQLIVIRDMAHELALPIEILGIDTIRAADGLALSSRNGYLSPAERAQAPRLYRQLAAIAEAVRQGARDFAAREAAALIDLQRHGWQPDYLTVRRRADLRPPKSADEPLVALAAARLGATRLIDNLEIQGE